MDSTARHQIERQVSVYPAGVRYRDETRRLAVALRLKAPCVLVRVILQRPSFSLAQVLALSRLPKGSLTGLNRIPATPVGDKHPEREGWRIAIVEKSCCLVPLVATVGSDWRI